MSRLIATNSIYEVCDKWVHDDQAGSSAIRDDSLYTADDHLLQYKIKHIQKFYTSSAEQ